MTNNNNSNDNNNNKSFGDNTDMTACNNNQNNHNNSTTNDTVTAEHTETSSNSIILPNVLFGTLNQEIADHFDQVMKVQLTKTLNTLPNLDGTHHIKLHDYIYTKHYRKASDFIELYGIRNIFSLHMYNNNKSMQETICNLYQQYNIENSNSNDRTWDESEWICYSENDDESMSLKKKKKSAESKDTTDLTTNMNQDDIDIVLPTDMNQIPTTNDIQILTNEISTLNITLQQLQKQYQSLSKEVNVLQQLHDNTTTSSSKENIIQSSQQITNTITKHVNHTIPIIQTLHNYTNTSNQLQQYMNTIQNERTSNNNNNNNEKSNIPIDMIIDPITILPSNKTKQQLQNNSSNNIYTRYEQDILQQNGTTSSTLHNMIQTIQPK